MTTRANEERQAAAQMMLDPNVSDEDAAALCMLVHTVTPGTRWTCSCEQAPGLGTSSYAHQGHEVVALLRRRGSLR